MAETFEAWLLMAAENTNIDEFTENLKHYCKVKKVSYPKYRIKAGEIFEKHGINLPGDELVEVNFDPPVKQIELPITSQEEAKQIAKDNFETMLIDQHTPTALVTVSKKGKTYKRYESKKVYQDFKKTTTVCLCGCGYLPKDGNLFLMGHSRTLRFLFANYSKTKKQYQVDVESLPTGALDYAREAWPQFFSNGEV